MSHHNSNSRARDHVWTRRRFSFRPTLVALEDRTTPAGGGWATTADPEGFVYHDVNGNGTFDAGESAMGAGLTVYVDTNNNGVLDAGETNTTTDATGHYSIILPDGTYSIRVIAPSGFQDDARPLGTLVTDFASLENGANNNFSGLAWVNDSLYVTFSHNDTMAVMYQIDPATGTALGSAVAVPDDVGEITFDGTDFWGVAWKDNFRNYSIIRFNFAGQELQRLTPTDIVNPAGIEWDGAALRVLDQNNDRIYQIDPTGNGTILGSIPAPSDAISLAFDGTSFWASGNQSDRVYALDPSTGAIQKSFAHHGSLGYGMAIHGSNLWLSDNHASRVYQYDLGYGGGRIVTVAGADVTGVNLAVLQPTSISGRVFSDNNQNGVQDSNDGGLAGWRVYIDSTSNGQYDAWETSAVTDSLGNYTFSGLRPGGPYAVALDLAAQRLTRWSQVAPAGGNYSLSLNSGDAISGKNFAYFLDRSAPQPNEWGDFEGGRMNLYTGLAWYDVTQHSGTILTLSQATSTAADSTQGGFDDWRLPNKTEALQAAANDYASQVWNPGTGPSTYFLWWTSTAVNNRSQWTVSVNDPTRSATSVLISNSYLYATTVRDSGIVIDDGNTGYTATGFTSKGTSGTYQGDQSTAASGTGSKTATWTFGGLEVGATYKVSVTWKSVGGAASNSPFKVIDGANTVATVGVNQQVTPGDYSIADIGWKGLGTFTISSNTLKVQLSNLANGTVIADAVRIFKVFPSYAPPPALLAAAAPTTPPATAPLSAAQVQPLLNEAMRRWALAGADTAAVGPVTVQIADLPGNTLGQAQGHTITLDATADGWGWFVDPTPRSDAEFLTPGDQGEQNRMDLLTVLMHEYGHILGHDHAEGGVMTETLTPGTRENPDGLPLTALSLAWIPLASPMPVLTPTAWDTDANQHHATANIALGDVTALGPIASRSWMN